MSTLDNPNEMVSPEHVSPWPTGNRYGLIAGLILVAVGLVIHLAGIVDYSNQSSGGNWVANIANWGVMIAAIVMAVKYHRDEELGGHITFGRAFYVGFIVTLLIAVITLVWSYVFFGFIESGLLTEMTEMTREQMIEEQGLSEEQVEQAMSYTAMFFTPGGMALMAGIGTIFIGLVISLIAGGIMKKTPAHA